MISIHELSRRGLLGNSQKLSGTTLVGNSGAQKPHQAEEKRYTCLCNMGPVRIPSSNHESRAMSTQMKESPIDSRKTVGMNNARSLLYLTTRGSRFVSTSRPSLDACRHSQVRVKLARMLCIA